MQREPCASHPAPRLGLDAASSPSPSSLPSASSSSAWQASEKRPTSGRRPMARSPSSTGTSSRLPRRTGPGSRSPRRCRRGSSPSVSHPTAPAWPIARLGTPRIDRCRQRRRVAPSGGVGGEPRVADAAQVATRGPFVWSPDSRRLAFTAAIGDGKRAIDVVDADGSNLTNLIPDGAAPAIDRFDPTWSPDGQWISFFSTDAQHSIAINVVHPGGSDARRLATSPVNPEYLELSWAPDPTQARFAFVSGGDLRIFDLATAKETTVAEGFWASWSPDARRIAWWDAPASGPTAAEVGGIQVALVDNVLAGRPSQVKLFPDVNNNSCYARIAGVGICSPAAWSPDSRWVFGPDPTGSSIVFGTVDEPRITRTIALDRAVDLSGGPHGDVAWQAIAP